MKINYICTFEKKKKNHFKLIFIFIINQHIFLLKNKIYDNNYFKVHE